MSGAGDVSSSDPRPQEGQSIANREKLSKLGLLVAGIAHNLYGPLTGILGTMDLLKLKYPDLKEDFERVSNLGYRLQDEIKVMLYKAQIEARGLVGHVNFRELILNELEFYKGDPRLKHMIALDVDIPEDTPVFIGISADLLMAFSNLLTNAVEAMDSATTRKLRVALEHDAETITITLVDSGIGMDGDTLAKAFEPFFTTKTPAEGGKFPPILATGLGLTHARGLLEPYGGSITLASEPGKGTTATMTVPWKRIHDRFSGA